MNDWLLIALGASGWAIALIGFAVSSQRQRREKLRRALELRARLRPYLLRRTAEAGLPPRETAGTSADEILDELVELATALQRHERGESEHAAEADTMSMAVSDTLPADSGSGQRADLLKE
ncbi:MAG: hypothetical protein KC503_38250 [Myxococcales bacterium]|nr:hypothetical protein [Myxococcales bacterium]